MNHTHGNQFVFTIQDVKVTVSAKGKKGNDLLPIMYIVKDYISKMG